MSDLECRKISIGNSLLESTPHRLRDRVDEKFPVVLVSGCHIGDCHNIDANHWTEKRVNRIREKMSKMGIRPERLQLEWISAAEGIRFARLNFYEFTLQFKSFSFFHIHSPDSF